MKQRHSRRAKGSVINKRGLWYFLLTLGYDEHGRQLRHWSIGYKTKALAELGLSAYLQQDRREKESGRTVKSVVESYIEHDFTAKGRRSPTTTQRYKGLLKNMGPIHDKRVERLDGATLDGFFGTLQHKLQQTTVHHVYNLMVAAFRWAKRKRLIAVNPFETEDVDPMRRGESSAQALTIEQARRAINYIKATKHANALIFSLAAACRRGETCGLKWDAVDWDRRVAVIREARYQVSKEQGQKAVKSRRIREIPLNETALSALRRELERQELWKREAGDAWVDSGHVFVDEFGQALSPMALTNAFGRCAKNAGLPTTRMHDLRHTAATFILSGGGNPVAATKILGHSEEGTTLRLYGHVIGEDEVRAARQIDKALSRQLSRRAQKKAQKTPINTKQTLVAPTGIEPVFPP